MAKQSIGLKHRPKLMLIDDADRPAKWYFALKAAYLGISADWCAYGASDGWAGDVALAIVKVRRVAAWAKDAGLKGRRYKGEEFALR